MTKRTTRRITTRPRNTPGITGRRFRPALLLLLWPMLVGWSFFDPFHEHVEKGNRHAKDGKAELAVPEYDQAARTNPSSPIPDFNKGTALAKGGSADAARDALLAAAASKDPGIAADALYNLGNVYLGEQRFGEAIDSYLKSLDLDPKDPDARRNLEIALRRLQEQQQQQQQQQNQPQKNDDEKKDDEKQQQQQQQPEQKPDSKPDDQQQQEQQPTPQDSTQTPSEERFTREDAERLLNAIQSDELKVLDQLRKKEGKEVTTNDW